MEEQYCLETAVLIVITESISLTVFQDYPEMLFYLSQKENECVFSYIQKTFVSKNKCAFPPTPKSFFFFPIFP